MARRKTSHRTENNKPTQQPDSFDDESHYQERNIEPMTPSTTGARSRHKPKTGIGRALLMNHKGNDPWLNEKRNRLLGGGRLTAQEWGLASTTLNDLAAIEPTLFGLDNAAAAFLPFIGRCGMSDLRPPQRAVNTPSPRRVDALDRQQTAPRHTWLKNHLEGLVPSGALDFFQRYCLWVLRQGRQLTPYEAGVGSLMKQDRYKGPKPEWSPHPDYLAYLASLSSAEPPHSEPSGPTTAQPQSDPHSDCAALVRRLTEAHPRPARSKTHSALRQARDAGMLDEYLSYICWRWDHDGVVSHVEAGHAIAWSNGEYHGPRSDTWVRPPAFLEWLERQPCSADR